jgi:hypothetical protein
MKRSLFCAALIASAALGTQAYAADAKPIEIKEIGAVNAIQAKATVLAIDMKNRVVTLKAENGHEFSITAGPEVRNLDKIKVGDIVVTTYYEAVAVSAKKTDAAPMMTVETEGARAKKGEQPGAAVMRRIHVVTTVLGHNADTQTILVRGPLGHLTEVKIRDPKVFEELKGGGNVDLVYVEGVAIGVTPGGKK